MLNDWKQERFIMKTLHRLSRQRVLLILQPGNAWVIENVVSEENEQVAAALRTCHLRGWVEVQQNAVPRMRLTPEGNFPERDLPDGIAPVYRLTEAGWNVIHRSHEWIMVTCVIASATLVVTILGIIVTITLIGK